MHKREQEVTKILSLVKMADNIPSVSYIFFNILHQVKNSLLVKRANSDSKISNDPVCKIKKKKKKNFQLCECTGKSDFSLTTSVPQIYFQFLVS